MGNLLENTSLKKLLEKQGDFVSELTLLQYHAQLLGAMVDRTPKCHPELAGEGIEYAWALAKLFYRRQQLNMKRSKTNFINLVRSSTSRDEVLRIEQVRKCSKRAREYMLGYKALQDITKNQAEQEADLERTFDRTSKYNYTLIEKIIKTYKTHRNCLDTDTKWLTKVLGEVGKDSFELLTSVVKRMDTMKCEITKM